MSRPVAEVRRLLEQYARELAAEHQLTAHALREEHEHFGAPGAGDFDDHRFALEDLANAVGSEEDDTAALKTLVEHHEFCGGGTVYRPGAKVQGALAEMSSRSTGYANLGLWLRAAAIEMGHRPDTEEAA